jgi:hypothetical protein
MLSGYRRGKIMSEWLHGVLEYMLAQIEIDKAEAQKRRIE